jgi:hypothetical protein
MKGKRRSLRTAFSKVKSLLAVLAILGAGLIVFVFISKPPNPATEITVIDSAGNPISGAVITPYALRPKTDGGRSGHYAWTTNRPDAKPDPVVTDNTGAAVLPFPKYVIEQVETEKISFTIKHPEFVSDTSEVIVSGAPASGAPWRVWFDYWLNRIKRKAVMSRSGPITLERGGVVILAPTGTNGLSRILAQSSSRGATDPDFWSSTNTTSIATMKNETGTHSVRLIGMNDSGDTLFSDVTNIMVAAGMTNQLGLELRPGLSVRGRLDLTVPRPVTNGVVVMNIVPAGRQLADHPPVWHSWSKINPDGSFEFLSLPSGDLEIVALCNGFVSTNSPGSSPNITLPQKHLLGTTALEITIGMEPTARLEVTVRDENGNLIEGARAVTSPNVQWGKFSSTIFCSDLYNSIDLLRLTNAPARGFWRSVPAGFSGVSDETGVAVVSNVPVATTVFTVGHTNYVLPKLKTAFGSEERQLPVSLSPNTTTKISVTLEPKEKDPMRHY